MEVWVPLLVAIFAALGSGYSLWRQRGLMGAQQKLAEAEGAEAYTKATDQATKLVMELQARLDGEIDTRRQLQEDFAVIKTLLATEQDKGIIMGRRIIDLERDNADLRKMLEKMEAQLARYAAGVNQLIGQLKKAGEEPVWVPDTGELKGDKL
jgi:septal ring factor EnvC (AmiA/AmiB activator)